MANEENKQFNRFQFSTEIDRGEDDNPKKKKTTSRRTRKNNNNSRRGTRRTTKNKKKELLKGDSNMNKKEEKIEILDDSEEIKKIMDSIVIEDDDPTDDVDQYKEELKKSINKSKVNEKYKEEIEKIMDTIVIEDDDPTDDVDQYKEELKKIMDSIVIEEDEDNYKEKVKKIMDSIVIEDDDPTDDVENFKEEFKKGIEELPVDENSKKYKEQIERIMNSIVIEDNEAREDVDKYKQQLKEIMDSIVIEEDEAIPTADFKVFADDAPPMEKKNNGEEGITVSAEDIVVNEEKNEETVDEKDKESQAFLAELDKLKEKGININEVRDVDLEHTLYRDQYFIKEDAEDKVVEEVKNAIENTSELSAVDIAEASRTIRKVYLSFRARVILLTVGILILFAAACFIIASALDNNTIRKIGYTEKSTIEYEVCQNVMNVTNVACMPSGQTYKASTTSKIPLKYHYEAKFDEEIDYDLSYHVVIVDKIFDHNDASKVLYSDDTIAIEKTKIQEGMSPVKIDVDVDVDFQKYYNLVNEYKQKYSMNAESQLSVVLYIDDGSDTRNVGEVIIPITTENYNLTRNEVKDQKQEYALAERDWTNANTIYIIVGSVLVLLSLFLLFHLTKLALSVTGKKSKYQEYLMSILNEYDRLIVIARDGYESNIEKRVVKVYTFDELLDARNSLNKPIIYSRINNVKSEFIVEDDEVIYKFVLKEADMGE